MMQFLDLTLPTPVENLAMDEAILEEAEEREMDGVSDTCEVLRIWESPVNCVVVGRSSSVKKEVQWEYCQSHDIPVLRRCSGGASIVSGPGCLMYAVVLSYAKHPELQAIDQAHQYVLGKICEAVRHVGRNSRLSGISDLTIDGQKFSGNSLRCKRGHLLYHGTLLYNFPLKLIAECLDVAPRQPSYREGRDHLSFVTNLEVDPNELRSAIVREWQAEGAIITWPADRIRELVATKYSQDSWNYRI